MKEGFRGKQGIMSGRENVCICQWPVGFHLQHHTAPYAKTVYLKNQKLVIKRNKTNNKTGVFSFL